MLCIISNYKLYKYFHYASLNNILHEYTFEVFKVFVHMKIHVNI